MPHSLIKVFEKALKEGGHHTFHALHFIVENINQLVEVQGKVAAYQVRSDPFSHSPERLQIGLREFNKLVDLGLAKETGRTKKGILKGLIFEEIIEKIHDHHSNFESIIAKSGSVTHKQTRFESEIEAMLDSENLPELKAAMFLLNNIEAIAGGSLSAFTVYKGREKPETGDSILIEADVYDALHKRGMAVRSHSESGKSFKASLNTKQIKQMWHESIYHQNEIKEWQKLALQRISDLNDSHIKK